MSWTMLIQHPNIQINYRLNNWRDGFRTKAAEALKRYIEVDQAEFFDDCQVIANWIQFSLTPDGDPQLILSSGRSGILMTKLER
jgi:hypothetical protein